MKINGVELRRLAMPLKAPFRTSFGVTSSRDVLLIRVVTADAEGWGECVTLSEPRYNAEYVEGAADMLRRFLIPALACAERPHLAGAAFAPFKGHRMAKAGLEAAVLDAWLRSSGESLAGYLGAEKNRVPAGVSVGIMETIPELLNAVEGYVAEGTSGSS
ncbi:hypothetical protein [Nonomuraea typhae]|uniref:hypothetical protein n=1 Tax=Nonomuraea typhae TaxID=2603600 RepID=UPI001FEA42C8|nr:hypothetical protein [Nonomuraea typhae]